MDVLLLNPTKQVRKTVSVLSQEFKQDGHSVTVISPKGTHDNISDSVNLVEFEARFIPGIRYTIPKLNFMKIVTREVSKSDVVIVASCLYPSSLIVSSICKFKKTPCILTVDALPGFGWSYGSTIVDIIGTTYIMTFGRLSFKISNKVVGLGDYLAQTLRELTDTSVDIIPNGIDTNVYSPSSNQELSSQKLNVLYVGRLDPVKGVQNLIEAIHKFNVETENPIELTIVGDGTEMDEYKKQVCDLGLDDQIKFCGWQGQGEVVEYYNMSDILILPSKSEGQPSVLLEAQSCQTPVIATDVGGINELVHSGYVIPPENSQAIVDSLKQAIEDGILAPQPSAREFVQEKYSKKSMKESYYDIIEQIANK